jgi:hypothetical protein
MRHSNAAARHQSARKLNGRQRRRRSRFIYLNGGR